MRGLYWKIYAAFILTSALAILVTLAFAIFYRQYSNETNNVIAPTEGYISSAELMLQRGGEPLLIEWLMTFEKHPSVNAYVFDSQGESLMGGMVSAEVSAYAFAKEQLEVKVQPLKRSEILVKAPLQSLSGHYYLLVIEFFHPFSVLDFKAYIYAGLLAAVFFFGGIGFLLSAYLSRPVRHLQKTVKAVAMGNLNARVHPALLARKDEIGDLGREFDIMTERVQTLLGDQKGLLRDISHELRSPLARLQIATELARFEVTQETLSHLDRIELETLRLDALIADILLLARLEVDRHPEQCQTIDLVAMLQQITQDAHFEQQSETIRLCVPDDACWVFAEHKPLASGFENLIRNALLHTAANTLVDVTIEASRQHYLVIVRDHGPGVDAEHLVHLTKPFYRAEHARQRLAQDVSKQQSGGRGYGLGLAIAQRAMKSFGGTMTLRNHPKGGLEIRCTLEKMAAS